MPLDTMQKLLTGSTEIGGRELNDLADEFRCGRNIFEIIELLDADDPEVVSVGAWILSELPWELYCVDEILGRLRRLMIHSDPGVRSYTLSAMYIALSDGDHEARVQLRRLCFDAHQGVRKYARSIAAQIGISLPEDVDDS